MNDNSIIEHRLTRRLVLGRGLQLPVVGLAAWALSGCEKAPKAQACAGPDTLTSSEASLRDASHYVEAATDPAKVCTDCEFFQPGETGSFCGKCTVLLGPANPRGHCDSWAAKKA